MKSKILAGLGILGLSLTAFATGCGDSDSQSTGGGGGGDTTTTGVGTGTTISANSVTATQSSTGTMGGDGNDTFADADPLDDNMGVQSILSELNPPDTDVDFWTFSSPGGLTSILMDAKPDDDGFADGYMDLIIEVYDADQNLLATNDDPFPRDTQDPHLLTILPAGNFFVKVAEWCATPEAAGVCGDDYFDNLESLDYAVNVFPQSAFDDTAIAEVEPNDTQAQATPSEFVESMTDGAYYLNYGFGEFADTDDVEFFSFTVPTNVTLTTGRLTNDLIFQPPTTLGSGSARFTGVVDILNAGGDVIARQDWSGQTESANYRQISGAPLIAGDQYFIRVSAGATATAPLPPFFIYTHNLSGSNPLEQAELTNNLIVSPEELFTDADPDSYFIEGDLGDGDTDHFLVQAAGTYFAYSCSGERSGSGVRGLTVTVLAADNAMELASFSESADEDLFDFDKETGTETALVFRITKTSQASGVTGNYYRCGFHFYEELLEP